MNTIQCTNCGEIVPSPNIDLQKVTAKCSVCQTIFDFSQQEPQSYKVRPKIELPANFEVSEHSNSLHIAYKWFSIKHIIFFIIPLPFIIFSLEWLYNSITEGQWIMMFFGLLPLAIGSLFSYIAFLNLFNKTYILINKDELLITHEPIPSPWHRDWALKCDEISQFYCKSNGSKDDSIENYDLYVVDKYLSHTKLLSDFTSSEQALYLEQEFERFLNIEDRKVAGELE